MARKTFVRFPSPRAILALTPPTPAFAHVNHFAIPLFCYSSGSGISSRGESVRGH